MSDSIPLEPEKRLYHSPVRQRQAEETHQRMLAAARKLLLQRGYAGTTIEAIAEEGGVSPKTVVANFGTKRGILTELLSPAAFGQRYQDIRAQLRAEPDPKQRSALVARLARQVYEELTPEFDLLRGAGAVAPELAELARNVEQRRWQQQRQFIVFLQEQDKLRTDITREEATDIIWTLTSFEVYRMLIRERAWQPERYESWLTKAIIEQVLRQDRATLENGY